MPPSLTKKKIKICHISTVHCVDDVRIYYKICLQLKKCGYDVHLIGKPPKHLKKPQIGISLIKIRTANRFLRMWQSCAEAISLAQKINPHVCHFHDPELIPWAIFFLKPLGIRLVYDVHEDYEKQFLSKEYLPLGLRAIFGKMIYLMELLGWLIFDKVITATPQISKKFPIKKTMVVQNFP